ncbi:tail fiber protein [Leptolyngbya sp. CCNP1308]|uniref:phage tail protein n=1 Tax=Leptolyngbya sp. CCNP1308 TaxID=3110255 RepID=UPI002B1EC23D|nr:tail fiber protein [Leptolyngbya sp. CCNP1308]MEA5448215.1 tail fiber protein [Leptolyngbya sp. CCNP1308]
MSDPFIGEIRMFAGNFAPRGWAFCNGQLMPISQNTALFSLLGTTYGGDGRVTFALPDLRGRVPLHAGQGAGLSDYPLGSRGGVEQVALTTEQLPAHSHALLASDADSDQRTPANHILAMPEETPIYSASNPTAAMANGAIAPTGSSQPHENRPPYLAMNYIIALFGIFPSRQ